MSSGHDVVDEVHVGGREQVESEWKTVRVVFHDFASLPPKLGDETRSPVFECHGLKWKLIVYPGGAYDESTTYLSLYMESLSCSSTKKIKAQCRFRIPSSGKSEENNVTWNTYAPRNTDATEAEAWGVKNVALRSNILDLSKNYLVGGNLTVELDIQVMFDKPPTWTPTNTVCSDMLKMLEAGSSDNCDVAFEVGVNEPNVFHAHRNILVARAPAIADFIADISDPCSMIPIKDVEPNIFRMVLRFIYGGEVPAKNMLTENARSIIHAADKYGGTGLKLSAEAQLTSDGITTENAAELILFADGTNCAQLKEAAMEHFAKNAQAVMSTKGFEEVKESPSILTELMSIALGGGSKKRQASADADNDRDYKRMRVATLRQKLDQKKLDVDGSKEMLISRLKAADDAEVEAAAQAEAENNNEEEESDNVED